MNDTFTWPVPSYYELLAGAAADQAGAGAPAAVVTMQMAGGRPVWYSI